MAEQAQPGAAAGAPTWGQQKLADNVKSKRDEIWEQKRQQHAERNRRPPPQLLPQQQQPMQSGPAPAYPPPQQQYHTSDSRQPPPQYAYPPQLQHAHQPQPNALRHQPYPPTHYASEALQQAPPGLMVKAPPRVKPPPPIRPPPFAFDAAPVRAVPQPPTIDYSAGPAAGAPHLLCGGALGSGQLPPPKAPLPRDPLPFGADAYEGGPPLLEPPSQPAPPPRAKVPFASDLTTEDKPLLPPPQPFTFRSPFAHGESNGHSHSRPQHIAHRATDLYAIHPPMAWRPPEPPSADAAPEYNEAHYAEFMVRQKEPPEGAPAQIRRSTWERRVAQEGMHAADTGTGLPMSLAPHHASRDPRHAPTDISKDQHLRDADYIATNGEPREYGAARVWDT